MELDLFVGGSAGPGCRLMHFHWKEKYFNSLKQPIFHLV